RLRSGGEIPVDDLRAGPELDVGIGEAVSRQNPPLRLLVLWRGSSRSLDHRGSMPAGRRGTKAADSSARPQAAMLHRTAWYVSNAAILAGPRGHSRCLHIPSPA